MSLAAVSCVYADGLQEVRFNHFVATGQSAMFVTQDEPGYATIRAAIFGEKAPSANEGQETRDRPCD